MAAPHQRGGQQGVRPAAWDRGARCVHVHESVDWHYGPGRTGGRRWNGYYGGMQFTLGTWQRADVILRQHASPQWSTPAVQLEHAYAIWKQDGRSWREWPTSSRECGLR